MELLLVAIAAAVLTPSATRRSRRRRAARLVSALEEIEAAAPVVIADWPATHRHELAAILARERVARSAAYRQGLHTAESRQQDYALLQRIGAAETRLRTARHLASASRSTTRSAA